MYLNHLLTCLLCSSFVLSDIVELPISADLGLFSTNLHQLQTELRQGNVDLQTQLEPVSSNTLTRPVTVRIGVRETSMAS